MGAIERGQLVDGWDMKAEGQGQFGTYWAKKQSQTVSVVKGWPPYLKKGGDSCSRD